jgi:hypothetical protein
LDEEGTPLRIVEVYDIDDIDIAAGEWGMVSSEI